MAMHSFAHDTYLPPLQTGMFVPSLTRRGLPRSSLACLSCRVAKSKCDGVVPAAIAASTVDGAGKQQVLHPAVKAGQQGQHGEAAPALAVAEMPCSRCARLGLTCEWRPCQRLGRPPGSESASRKKANDEEGASAQPKRRRAQAERALFNDQDAYSSQSRQPSSSSGRASSAGNCSTELGSSGDDSELLSASIAEDIRQTVKSFVPSADSSPNSSVFAATEALPTDLDALIASWAGGFVPGEVDSLTEANSPSKVRNGLVERNSASQQFTELQSRVRAADDLTPALLVIDQKGQESASHSFHLPRAGFPPEVHIGLERYFAGVGTAIPLLGDYTQLWQRSRNVDSALVLSAASLGHILHEGHQGATYGVTRAQSIEELSKPFRPQRALPDHSNLDRICALILCVYGDYGEGDMMMAQTHMEMVRGLATFCNLHRLDASDGPVQHQAINPIEVNRARLVWWELFTLDVILDIASSAMVPRGLQKVPSIVHVPSTDGEVDEVYHIRVRSVSLLSDILANPADVRQAPRLDTLDLMLGNLLGQAQTLWVARMKLSLSCGTTRAGASHKKILAMRPLMQGLLILHAARVHLHRQAWFSGLTLDMKSCSFMRAPQSSDSNASSAEFGTSAFATHHDPKRLSTSIAHITRSSDAILNLMQLDADMHFSRLQSALSKDAGSSTEGDKGEDVLAVPIVAPHWPFVGCCQMVAAYGFALAAAAANQDRHSLSSPFHATHSVALATPASDRPVASYIDASVAARDGSPRSSEWRVRRSVSSIAFAESTLGILMQVWKIAGMYRQEVNHCRLAIDMSLGDKVEDDLQIYS